MKIRFVLFIFFSLLLANINAQNTLLATIETKNVGDSVVVSINHEVKQNFDVKVDWGDGSQKTITMNVQVPGAFIMPSLKGVSKNTKSVKIYGAVDNFVHFSLNKPASTLDVSACTKMQSLYTLNAGLSGLNINGCTELIYLDARENNLTELITTSVTKLNYLNLSNNKLVYLPTSHLTRLTTLNLSNNISFLGNGALLQGTYTHKSRNLVSVDVSGCTSLTSLLLDDNKIELVRLDGCTNLLLISLMGNKLESIDISGLKNLSSLSLSECPVTEVEAKNNDNLKTITVKNCAELVTLKTSKAPQLILVNAEGCAKLKNIDFSSNTKLVSLNLNGCTSLTGNLSLETKFTQLETLTLSNTKFKNVFVAGASLANKYILNSINVSGCDSLKELRCYYTDLKTLDVSGLDSLKFLNCGGNPSLKSLTLTNCNKLETLFCHETDLTNLDLSSCVNLLYLNTTSNKIATLNTEACLALETLVCSPSNSISSINCNGSELTSLDLTNCTALTNLDCGNNNLTFASLKLPKSVGDASWSSLVYSPQALISIDASYTTDEDLDLSHIEAEEHEWFDNENICLTEDQDYCVNEGVSTFLKGFTSVYCKMTHSDFPALELVSTQTEIVKNIPVSIDEIKDVKSSVFSRGLNIVICASNNAQYAIYNHAGILVKKGNCVTNETILPVPVKGVYLVKVEDNDKVITSKVICMK